MDTMGAQLMKCRELSCFISLAMNLTNLPRLGKLTNSEGLDLKKENIVLRELRNKVIIEGRTVSEIFFDLKHIQHGWDAEKRDYNLGPARNNYSEDDVVDFFEQLNTLVQAPRPQEAKLKSVDKRFVFYIYDGDKKLKMVVDLMKNSTTVVVTIH
jgi:hypothetical protein